MGSLLIRNAEIIDPGRDIARGDVLVRDGRIGAVGHVGRQHDGDEIIDAAGRRLTPGFVDLHTHGIQHSSYERGAEELVRATAVLGQFGVTTVLPTIVPQMGAGWLDKLAELADAILAIRTVHIPGLHLEGPFMAIAGAACPTLPGDPEVLERILDACHGRLSVMSVSPDTPNIVPIIRRLREADVTVFLTHTRATVEQTEAAIAAGATHATHFYDVFPLPAETEPGVRPVGAVETILASPRVTVDFIADGVHVHPMAIRAAVAAKTFAGVCLITDSNIGAGLPPGVYDTPWGFPVRVRDGDGARHATRNDLAGSALTMDRGMANLLSWLALPPEQVWAMGTSNPARVLGLASKGRIAIGADADLVLWDDELRPVKTWVAGNCVYEKDGRTI
jgi:N-acetylglucosamine-6-phosphate deacetylase